jgi:hypothetical protein
MGHVELTDAKYGTSTASSDASPRVQLVIATVRTKGACDVANVRTAPDGFVAARTSIGDPCAA